jgi:hypothetical protein
MTYIQKLQEREFQKLIVATIVCVLVLFGVGKTGDGTQDAVTKGVAGLVDAAVSVAYVASRGRLKQTYPALGQEPMWSPDGKWLLFRKDGEIYKVAIGGNSQPVPIEPTAAAATVTQP